MISVIIPHRGRDSLLLETLRSLERQSFESFDVVIVVDLPEGDNFDNVVRKIPTSFNIPIEIISGGGKGPATARNLGAEYARSDILLFIGSDCIAHKDLVGTHYMHHVYGADVIQGYTGWHPDVVSPVTDFIDNTGLQAAWANLKHGNGKWKREISPAFCMTTNYSIDKRIFLNEKFDESFSGAAWEDVEFGYRLEKYANAMHVLFVPEAFNLHYHRYTLNSFLERCRMEGYHRLTICKLHAEMSWDMCNPYTLRTAKDLNKAEVIKWAHELDSVDFRNMEDESVRNLRGIKYQRYYDACKLFSMKGVLQRIPDELPAMQALLHVHKAESVIQIVSGVAALEKGFLGYAAHTAQWLVAERPDDWSAYSYLGEVELGCKNKEEALMAFRKSLEINPTATWPKKRLEEMRSW